jgi:hypothetical protein
MSARIGWKGVAEENRVLGIAQELMPQVRPQPGRHRCGLIWPHHREGVGKAHADATGERAHVLKMHEGGDVVGGLEIDRLVDEPGLRLELPAAAEPEGRATLERGR